MSRPAGFFVLDFGEDQLDLTDNENLQSYKKALIYVRKTETFGCFMEKMEVDYSVQYTPAENDSGFFVANSNSTRIGNYSNLDQIADSLSKRLAKIF